MSTIFGSLDQVVSVKELRSQLLELHQEQAVLVVKGPNPSNSTPPSWEFEQWISETYFWSLFIDLTSLFLELTPNPVHQILFPGQNDSFVIRLAEFKLYREMIINHLRLDEPLHPNFKNNHSRYLKFEPYPLIDPAAMKFSLRRFTPLIGFKPQSYGSDIDIYATPTLINRRKFFIYQSALTVLPNFGHIILTQEQLNLFQIKIQSLEITHLGL